MAQPAGGAPDAIGVHLDFQATNVASCDVRPCDVQIIWPKNIEVVQKIILARSEDNYIPQQLRRQLEADPYQPLRWDVEIGARLWTASDTRQFYTDVTEALSPADRKRLDQQKICYVLVDERLSGRGVPQVSAN